MDILENQELLYSDHVQEGSILFPPCLYEFYSLPSNKESHLDDSYI